LAGWRAVFRDLFSGINWSSGKEKEGICEECIGKKI